MIARLFRAVEGVVRGGSTVVPQGSSKDLLNGLHELPIRYMSLSGSGLKRWFMSILSWRASGLGGIQIMVIVVETEGVVLDYDMISQFACSHIITAQNFGL